MNRGSRKKWGEEETQRKGMKGMPARELENSDPFRLGIIRTTQNCKNPAHDREEEGDGIKTRGGEEKSRESEEKMKENWRKTRGG